MTGKKVTACLIGETNAMDTWLLRLADAILSEPGF